MGRNGAEKLREILDKIPNEQDMSDALTAMANYASSTAQFFDALLANQDARALREVRNRLDAILLQPTRTSSPTTAGGQYATAQSPR